jgi:hypothetical protein
MDAELCTDGIGHTSLFGAMAKMDRHENKKEKLDVLYR